MTRAITSWLMALALALTGFSLAGARGTSPDIGVEIVICSGVGVTTIRVGPDGQPIEEVHLCPDATGLFLAAVTLPVMATPPARVHPFHPPALVRLAHDHPAPAPSARGPPLLS